MTIDDRSRGGYYRTAWPSEHTDLWRSHCVASGGLPAEAFNGGQTPELNVAHATLNLPMWGYTRSVDAVFVYGGSPVLLAEFTKSITDAAGSGAVDPLSIQRRSTPYVARLDTRSMEATLFEMTLGRTVNYNGGLLMHANGFVYAVAQSVLYKIDPGAMAAVATLHLPLVGATEAEHFATTYNGMQVLSNGQIVLKAFSLTGSAAASGWLLLVDPDTLNIDIKQAADTSSARLTIEQRAEGACYLYMVNANQSTRYLVTSSGFVIDSAWTRAYRADDSGSTQASSPLLFGKVGDIVFADNTAPGATTPIDLYVQPLTEFDRPSVLAPTPAFSERLPGFNFFMVAGDPFFGQVVVYFDPINALLAAHRLVRDGLQLMWERNTYRPSASQAIVVDSDLLYIDDYRDGRDHFVVLRLSTGAELARVALEAVLPTIGTIFVGDNDDVFIISSEAGGPPGLVSRITLKPPAP